MPRPVRLRRFLAALLLVLICLPPIPVSAAELYFTAINDSLLPLTADTMPVWSGGVLYVPYTVFDANATGIHLGLNSSYGRSSNTVTIFTLRDMLLFDLSAGNSRNEMTGETYSGRAIMRNGRPYLPLGVVCAFFGMSYSYTSVGTVSQGYLVRIKSEGAVLSDSKFIDAAGNLISSRLREYNQSLNPTTDPPELPGVPAPPPVGSVGPVASSTQSDTYLALRWEGGDGLGEILDTLDYHGVYGLFLLTPQALEQQGDLVRRMLGTGHSVGLLALGDSAQQTRALLEEGNRLLTQLARTRTTIALIPREQQAEYSAEGWVCWNETRALTPTQQVSASSFASATLRSLGKRTQATYLTLPINADAARVLPTLLRQLASNHFVVGIPLETRL